MAWQLILHPMWSFQRHFDMTLFSRYSYITLILVLTVSQCKKKSGEHIQGDKLENYSQVSPEKISPDNLTNDPGNMKLSLYIVNQPKVHIWSDMSLSSVVLDTFYKGKLVHLYEDASSNTDWLGIPFDMGYGKPKKIGWIPFKNVSKVTRTEDSVSYHMEIKAGHETYERLYATNVLSNGKRMMNVHLTGKNNSKDIFSYEYGTEQYAYSWHGIRNVIDMNEDTNDDFIVSMYDDTTQRYYLYLSEGDKYVPYDLLLLVAEESKTDIDLKRVGKSNFHFSVEDKSFTIQYGVDVDIPRGRPVHKAVISFDIDQQRFVVHTSTDQ